MMITRLFSVNDTVGDVFHPPMAFASEGVCLRALKQVLATPTHPYAVNPRDYVVYEVGQFDEASGMVIQDAPRRICVLSQLLTMDG